MNSSLPQVTLSGYLNSSSLSLFSRWAPYVTNVLCLLHDQRGETSPYRFLHAFYPFFQSWAVVPACTLLWAQLAHSHQQVALQMCTQHRPEWYISYLCLLSFTHPLSAQQKWQGLLPSAVVQEINTALMWIQAYLCKWRLHSHTYIYLRRLTVQKKKKRVEFFLLNMAGFILHSVITHCLSLNGYSSICPFPLLGSVVLSDKQ